MRHILFPDRRRLLHVLAGAGAIAMLRPSAASAEQRSVLTRPIPSSGEALTVVGLGSWITFNVGTIRLRATPARG